LKLKIKVKEVLEERMHEKQMDYQEFSTLYPDDLACYRFLERLKDEKRIECQKCGNIKFSSALINFQGGVRAVVIMSRLQPIRSFTGLNFPLPKPFISPMSVFLIKEQQPSSRYQNKLSLRLNTAWAFKQKIKHRLNSNKTIESWEDIALDCRERSNKSPHVAEIKEFKNDVLMR